MISDTRIVFCCISIRLVGKHWFSSSCIVRCSVEISDQVTISSLASKPLSVNICNIYCAMHSHYFFSHRQVPPSLCHNLYAPSGTQCASGSSRKYGNILKSHKVNLESQSVEFLLMWANWDLKKKKVIALQEIKVTISENLGITV